MAQKRMFDKSIVDSDDFLDMPLTTQALYFHLNMRADDDGFIDNWKSIMRIIGAKDDDIKVLFTKKYIIPFDSGVIVIRHWKINNYLQKDRKKATRHIEEIQQLKEINGEYYLLEDGEISNILLLDDSEKETPEWQIKRDKAYKESSLPYSFLYKIRNAFNNEECPICKNKMLTSGHKKYIPTIQHLTPISKGGKHEIDNIAIICMSCNASIKDKEIEEKLNNDLVIKKWENILKNDKYLSRLTSGSIEENSIDKNSIEENNKENNIKESKHKYGEYKNVLLTDKELQSLKSDYDNYDELIKYLDEYIEMKGYKAKSHFLCIKKWVVKAVKQNNKFDIDEWLKKDEPEWMNKENHSEQVSDEELKDLEEEMSIFER